MLVRIYVFQALPMAVQHTRRTGKATLAARHMVFDAHGGSAALDCAPLDARTLLVEDQEIDRILARKILDTREPQRN